MKSKIIIPCLVLLMVVTTYAKQKVTIDTDAMSSIKKIAIVQLQQLYYCSVDWSISIGSRKDSKTGANVFFMDSTEVQSIYDTTFINLTNMLNGLNYEIATPKLDIIIDLKSKQSQSSLNAFYRTSKKRPIAFNNYRNQTFVIDKKKLDEFFNSIEDDVDAILVFEVKNNCSLFNRYGGGLMKMEFNTEIFNKKGERVLRFNSGEVLKKGFELKEITSEKLNTRDRLKTVGKNFSLMSPYLLEENISVINTLKSIISAE